MNPQELEARLDAHRRLLQWLVTHFVADKTAYDRLMASLDAPWPPVDFQEDPGAVPSEAFGAIAAYAKEMRLLLQPLREAPPN